MANNEVRIIGGQWKGRKLKFPDRVGLRPTLGRVRETLFNWLAPRIEGARCLDLFAGSGALGFEALSRGAATVTFVERDRKAASALRANATLLGAEARVQQLPAARFVSTDTACYDVIFFDPPFDDARALSLLPELLARHLGEDGVIYVEISRHDPLPAVGRTLKHGTAGDCQYALLAGEE
ncbi:MAG: 16S rRNA (guanine(966)-N(2))-methyltransferase RsmD [Pseudomonadales bacterium]